MGQGHQDARTDQPTVLIVEDEEPLADLYAQFLDDRYTTETVYSGEAALEAFDEDIDLVLLDRRMPGLSGDDVLRELQAAPYDCQVVMATAAYPDFEIVEVGFDNYIVKPIDRDELLDIVERTLAQATYETHLRDYYEIADRKSKLESKLPEGALEDNSEYRDLVGRMNRIRSRIDELLENIEGPGFVATVERTQTMAVLRESEERFRSMTEDVLDSSDVGTVIVDAAGQIEWLTASMAVYFGLDQDSVLQRDYSTVVTESIASKVVDGDRFSDRVLSALADNDQIEEFQCEVEAPPTDEGRWLKHWSKPIEHGLFEGGRIEHYYDISALKRREKTLEALHSATRQLIETETESAIGGKVAEIGVETLHAEAAAVYLRVEDSGALRSVRSESPSGGDEAEIIEPGSGLLWETFVDGEAREVDGSDLGLDFTADRSVMLRPLGTHGLLVMAFDDMNGIPTSIKPFIDVLAANAQVTLERAARERAIHERDDKLERQNDQLRRLNRINTAIRSISQGLIDASTRTEVETAVCDRLSRLDAIRFVWMGELDIVEGGLEPHQWAGEPEAYLETVSAASESGTTHPLPATQVAESRSPELVDNLLETPGSADWVSEALNRGFQSVVAIPVVYEESLFGVVELYADRPAVFGEDEREVLAELGETIGHGINAINRRDALLSDDLTELEFSISPDDIDFFSTLAKDIGTVDLRAVIPQSESTTMAFFVVPSTSVSGAIETADRSAAVEAIHLVRETEDETLFKCSVTARTAVTLVADNGAMPTRIRAQDGGDLRLTILVPGTTDVRSFHQRLSEQGFEAELVAQRQRSSGETVKSSLNQRIEDSLTDRQRESIQSAYYSGYFDWPREANGEEVATTLGIDQSTFQQHLRAGQRHVFETLFDTL